MVYVLEGGNHADDFRVIRRLLWSGLGLVVRRGRFLIVAPPAFTAALA
jgi:hypothetical protein